MSDYGITLTGFVRKTLDIIVAEREAAWRQTFGESIDTAPEGPIGQCIALEAEREAKLWELAEAAYGSLDPDKAVGQAQDAVGAITGTLRRGPKSSTVTLTLTGTPTTALDVGRVVSVLLTGSRFKTLAAVVIGALAARATTTAYLVGARVYSGTNAWECIGAGTSSGSATALVAPSASPWTVTDGTVVWYWLGAGTGAVDVAAASEVLGAVVAAAGTLRSIETPVAGWDGAANLEDALLGREVEGWADFRERREQELVANGGSLVESIRNAIMNPDNCPGVIECRVFQNSDYLPNLDGMPPNSIEVVVRGGADADIWNTIWFSGAAGGIYTHGTEVGTVVDSQNEDQTVRFSRFEEVEIWIAMTVKRFTRTFPVTGADDVRAAVVAFGAESGSGKNAVPHGIRAQAWKVPGVLDVPVCNVGIAINPTTETEVIISTRQVAVFSSARIAITLTSGTP